MRVTVETDDVSVVQRVMAACMAASTPVWMLGEPTPPQTKAPLPEPVSLGPVNLGAARNGRRGHTRHKCQHCGSGFVGQVNKRFCSKRCNANWYYATRFKKEKSDART